MFTLTILLILAVMVALFGCLMGLFSIIGLFFSLLRQRVKIPEAGRNLLCFPDFMCGKCPYHAV